MKYATMSLAVEEGIATITLTKGESGNPINEAFCNDLYDIANVLAGRCDARAILLRAEGKAFSYGGDISGFLPQLDNLSYIMRNWTGNFHTGILRLQRLDAPIVAAVNGVCAGGMAALVAGMDFVVGSERTKFVAAYAGIGLPCDGGASITLMERLGRTRARRYLLLNETIEGEDAMRAGLIDDFVGHDEVEAHARALAEKLAAGPTKAFGEVRRLLRTAGSLPAEVQLEAEAQAMSRAAETFDTREGITAFAERRKPLFQGR